MNVNVTHTIPINSSTVPDSSPPSIWATRILFKEPTIFPRELQHDHRESQLKSVSFLHSG
jgi:hypothetical protein